MTALVMRQLGSLDIEDAIVRDLGGGGACIRTELDLPVGAEVHVGFFLPGSGSAPVVAKVSVAWTRRDRTGSAHILGLAFVHAGAAQRQAIETLKDFLALREASI